MKYKDIYKAAIRIDKFIDMNKKSFALPIIEINAIIKYLFPSCYTKSHGWFKTVYTICPQRGSKGEMLILKIGKESSIKDDLKVYRMLPKEIRKEIFAKIHWHTRYCLLQEWGKEVKIISKNIEKMKLIAAKYGLEDIKSANIRKVGRKLKIIDASIFVKGKSTRVGVFKNYAKMLYFRQGKVR
jgi:hypothetical protein